MTAVTSVVARARIMRLQESMLALPPERQVEPAVRHFFANGMYAREMTIPAGLVVVGKRHKLAHFCTISQGTIRVHSEYGDELIHAPHTFITKPGTKRVLVALTDTVWTTYHHNPTNTEDMALIEAAHIAPDDAPLPQEQLE